MQANRSILTMLGVLASIAVVTTSCTDPSSEATTAASTTSRVVAPSSTTAVAGADPVAEAVDDNIPTADLDPAITTMVQNLAQKYRAANGVWPGFDPTEHPTVVAIKSGDELTGVVAVNHPDPGALGDATPISIEGLPFAAHVVDNPTVPEKLTAIQNFDFTSEQGGVDSFVMVANTADSFLAPTSAEFAATYIHEMFHRYQIKTFNESGQQDIEGYAYTAANLELATLEERALEAALTATTDAECDEAARRFAAIRIVRREAAPAVAGLDDPQEISEGTARYIEHRTASKDSGAAYHADNFERDLQTDLSNVAGVKETFGFGRFYASGAAIVELLDRMGVADYTGRIEANEAPASILADHLGVTAADSQALLGEARADYDPSNELPSQAASAAAAAESEPPVFGDDPGPAGDDGIGGGETGQPITDDELACLVGRGVDLDDENAQLSDEDFEACIG